MQAYLSAYAVILQCLLCHALVYVINANGVCLLVQCCFFSDMYNGINRWVYFREKSTLGNFIKKRGWTYSGEIMVITSPPGFPTRDKLSFP